MKKALLLLAIAAMALGASAQSLTHHTMLWDSVQREYILHVPDNMDTAQPRGMIFMLHGLRNHIDTVEGVVHVADFCRRSGWVCVVPQALDCPVNLGFGVINLEACWNVGIDVSIMGTEINLNAGVDDEGFLLALMDSLAGRYNIAPDSIFFTGISMGGFMTHRMAIRHGDRIAAAVPISGTIPNTFEDELPQHGAHPRIMHVHGTTDPVVTWQGDFFYRSMNLAVPHIGMPVEDCVRYWTDYNQCSAEAQIDSLADRCNDTLRFVRHTYAGGLAGSEVVLLEVIGGQHTWYGDPMAYDVDYSAEVYGFCTGREVSYPDIPAGIDVPGWEASVSLYPNPASSDAFLTLGSPADNLAIDIYDLRGRRVMHQAVAHAEPGAPVRLATHELPAGVYLVSLLTPGKAAAVKFVKH